MTTTLNTLSLLSPRKNTCCSTLELKGSKYIEGEFITDHLNGEMILQFKSYGIWFDAKSNNWIMGSLKDFKLKKLRGFHLSQGADYECPEDKIWLTYNSEKWEIDSKIELVCKKKAYLVEKPNKILNISTSFDNLCIKIYISNCI